MLEEVLTFAENETSAGQLDVHGSAAHGSSFQRELGAGGALVEDDMCI